MHETPSTTNILDSTNYYKDESFLSSIKKQMQESVHFHAFVEKILMDFKFKTPTNWIVVGSTQSGKTYFIKQVLENQERFFDKKIDTVTIFYRENQPLYDEIEKSLKKKGTSSKIKYTEVYPSIEDVTRDKDPKKVNIVIVDDLLAVMQEKENQEAMTDLCVRGTHHLILR